MGAGMTERTAQERSYLLKQAIREVLEEGRDEHKAIIQEAITAWLNDKFAQFGKWSLAGVGAAILAIIAYFLLIKGGWTPPR